MYRLLRFASVTGLMHRLFRTNNAMLLFSVKHTDDFFFGATSAGMAAGATKKWILSQYFIPYLARRESMAW